MTRHKLVISAVAVAFAVSVAPARAGQGKPGGEGGSAGGSESRPSSGGGGSESRPSGGGSSGGSSGSSSSAGLSGAPSSSSGASAASRPSASGPARERGNVSAPSRRGESGADRAVPRSSVSGDAARGQGRPSSTSAASAGADDRTSGPDRAVPAYSRPRQGRPPVGSAGVRTSPPPRSRDWYYPNYGRYGYGYYMPGFGYGLGYNYYDPFMFGGSYYGYQGGYGGYGGGYGRGSRYDTGALRLKVKPRHAQVLVDGYFVGTIDSYDGIFQRLGLEAGGHRVEIRADGFEPLEFDVLITPGETITYKGEMRRQP